jgi:hypothetical protein
VLLGERSPLIETFRNGAALICPRPTWSRPNRCLQPWTSRSNFNMDARSMEALLKEMSGRKAGGSSTFDMTKEVGLQLF